MDISEATEILQCPYDKSHQVMRKRMQVHLIKCRKNHQSAEKVTCPFNVTHVLNKVELEYHVSVCPERHSFERFKHREYENLEQFNEPNENQPQFDDGPNWENDPDVPTYNPNLYATNNPVLRLCQNATPSEKKVFRENERRRLINLKKY